MNATGEQHESLQAQALEQIKRSRGLRFHLAALLVGTVMLGGPWLAVEYVNADGWPQRFSDDGGAGDWNPLVPTVLIVWALLVAVKALALYFRRPPSEADLARRVRRLERSGPG